MLNFLSFIEQNIPSSGFTFDSFTRGILGLVTILIVAYFFSNNKKKINWRTVFIALFSQIILAILILKVGFIQKLFEGAGYAFVKLIDFTREGTLFVFGDLLKPNSTSYIWAFEILPTVIFFSAITSILFYFNVIQVVVKFFAKLYTRFLKISGSESLSVIGNIFLGQTEAPLMIKAYLPKMNKSEILLVMVGGMATVAGGVLAAYIAFLGGDDPVKQVVVSVTSFETSSNAFNVIPQEVKIKGTVRTLDPEVRDLAEKEFLRITKLTAEALGGSADAKYTRGYPVMSNSDQQTEFAAKVARDVSGKCDEAPLVMGGEDFAYMLEERPGAYILIGNGDSAPVHHPEYNFNDDAIPFGCSWLVEIVEQKMPV